MTVETEMVVDIIKQGILRRHRDTAQENERKVEQKSAKDRSKKSMIYGMGQTMARKGKECVNSEAIWRGRRL